MFNGQSFSLGWLECHFTHTRSLTKSEAERYIKLSKELEQNIDENIQKFISQVYPELLTTI